MEIGQIVKGTEPYIFVAAGKADKDTYGLIHQRFGEEIGILQGFPRGF
jgi:hypothetical protein